MMNKKGDSDWTVRKIVILILLLLVLVLLIVGLLSGKLRPLGENVEAKINSVLILFGVMDDPGGFGGGDCTASRSVSISMRDGSDGEGDFIVCRDGTCRLDFGDDVECLYGMNSESMSCSEIGIPITEQDKLFNHLFNGGLDEVYSLMGVDSYGDGLDKYMGMDSERLLMIQYYPYSYKIEGGSWAISDMSQDYKVIKKGDVLSDLIDEFRSRNFLSSENRYERVVTYFYYIDRSDVNNRIVKEDVDDFIKFVDELKSKDDKKDYFGSSGVGDKKISNVWELDAFTSLITYFFKDYDSYGVVPDEVMIDKLRSTVDSKVLLIDGDEYVLGVDIGKGGYPVFVMSQGGERYGLFFTGWLLSDNFVDVSGKKIELRSEPLRLMKWKTGGSGNIGWYSHGDIEKTKIPKNKFDGYYFINNLMSDNSILNFFKEECR
jgi:hypothetical protein